MKEELKEKQSAHRQQMRDVMRLQHQQWLEHPATVTMLNAIRKHRESFVGQLAANVSNMGMTDAHFRATAVNVRNTDAILALMTDAETLTRFLIPD